MRLDNSATDSSGQLERASYFSFHSRSYYFLSTNFRFPETIVVDRRNSPSNPGPFADPPICWREEKLHRMESTLVTN